MGQLTALVVGFILGLIVLGVVVSMKKPKERKPLLRPQKPPPADVAVTISPDGAAPDEFDVDANYSVTWMKGSGVDDFKIHFVDGTPFKDQNGQPAADFDSSHNSSGAASRPSATYCYYKYDLSIKVGGQWTTIDPGGRVWT